MRFNDFYLMEFAKPRDIDKNKTYYHGTTKKHNALSILKSGIKSGNITFNDNYCSSTPYKNRIYMTPDLEYALTYALGGHWCAPKASLKEEPYGYIFAIDGNDLVDIYPDEDAVAELLEFNKGPDWLMAMYDDLKNELTFEDLPIDLRLPDLDDEDEFVPTLEDYFDGIDSSFFIFIAKLLLNRMTDEQLLSLIQDTTAISNIGSVKPVKAWKFNKQDVIDNANQDISDFFEKFAKPIKIIS